MKRVLINFALIIYAVCIIGGFIALGWYVNYQQGFTIKSCISEMGHKENGTYYLKRGDSDEVDKSKYFILDSGKWSDNDGFSGTYELDGGKIKFYVGKDSSMPIMDGTLEGDTLKIASIGSYTTDYVRLE